MLTGFAIALPLTNTAPLLLLREWLLPLAGVMAKNQLLLLAVAVAVGAETAFDSTTTQPYKVENLIMNHEGHH